MVEIELHFTSSPLAELTEVRFARQECDAILHSIRGRVSGTPQTHRTFLWSPAVKAISILIASCKLEDDFNEEISKGVLRGNKGSFAASLDYAITKQPAWLTDMFGTYNGGNTYARRFILRSNSERKHPGPVIVTIDSRILPPSHIHIFQDRKKLDRKEINDLLKSLTKIDIRPKNNKTHAITTELVTTETPEAKDSTQGKTDDLRVDQRDEVERITTLPPGPFSNPLWHAGLLELYRREIFSGLASVDIFSRSGMVKTFATLSELSCLNKILVESNSFYQRLNHDLTSLSYRGMSGNFSWLRASLDDRPSLTFALTSVHVGAIAIARALQDSRKLNISSTYSSPYSTDIAYNVLASPIDKAPDLFCVNLATAGWLLNQGELSGYAPLMLMPSFTQRIQSKKFALEKTALKSGEFHFMCKVPTSAFLYYEELADKGIIHKRKTTVNETDLLDVPNLLDALNNDSRVISPFPFYRLYEIYDLDYMDYAIMEPNIGVRSTVLFAKESLLADSDLVANLILAIRDVWLEMMERGLLFEKTASSILNDHEYLRTISRFAGLKFLSSGKDDSCPALKTPSWASRAQNLLPLVA